MIKTTHPRRFAISVILLSSILPSCKKEDEKAAAKPAQASRPSLPATPKLLGAENAGSSIAQVAERARSKFEFKTLIETVGTKIAPEMMKQIESEGQSLPELNEVMAKGGRVYALGVQHDGGLVIHIADGYQIAFGYSFPSPTPGSSDVAENDFLSEFRLSSEGKTEVLNEKFDAMHIVVKKYVSKSKVNIEAVAYTHGTNRTLAFYDSSKVDAKKLLPSPPSAVGKDTIDKVKAMLKNSGK